ncbi:hypothetical protein B0H15DRAFT_246843 [Mycena belliarum]|uniref:MYND-type domain-containing protein n=1 Tax=Mycena belliarum TaxID=1033014 RepID=A0AAD6XQ19_9AGAR|nr:hypothetical protein B0H15DRAFT_246843 [Mycena belliae]
MAVFLPMPSEALRDPAKWDTDWEAFLRREFALPRGLRLCFEAKRIEIEVSPHGLDAALSGYPDLVFATCAIQRNITEEALAHFTRDNLEARWMNASSEVRGQHILGAMAAVCSKARNLNEARAYCSPELRLLRLRLDGKVFLDLLKSIMLEDASFIPNKPVYVSHPGWDAFITEQTRLNNTEAKKIALAEILLLRNKLIFHVVQFTLRSFLGLDPPVLSVRKQHKFLVQKKTPVHPIQKAVLVQALGPDAARARAKEERDDAKARINQRLGACSYMGCLNFEPRDGSRKFQRCRKCFEVMEREVLYCSRTCQTTDWKFRHKAICGKPLDFETACYSAQQIPDNRLSALHPEQGTDDVRFRCWKLRARVVSVLQRDSDDHG